jgi:hypothetical protein
VKRRSARAEACVTRGIRPEFYDPDGERYGLPTFPYHLAPDGMATKRQLRKKGLRPGGQDVAAQILWWHGGGCGRSGRPGRSKRVAYLYDESQAQPVREMTPARWDALAAAMSARMTCPSCGLPKPYCISKTLGECNECAGGTRGWS